LLVFLFLMSIYVFLRYLFCDAYIAQIITNIVYVILYVLAGFTLFQYGFPQNPDVLLASIISTGIITIPVILLIRIILSYKDKKQQKENELN